MSSQLVTRGAAAVALFALVVGTAVGQKLKDGEGDLDAALRKTRETWKELYEGREQADPKNKNHVTAIENAARDVVYRLHYEGRGRSVAPKSMYKHVSTLEARLSKFNKLKESTRSLARMYTRAVIDCCAEVISESNAIAGINAARMLSLLVERRTEAGLIENEKRWADEVLPRLAEGNGEHLADTMVKLLENKKANDGVRYYLLRALGNLMALPPQQPPLLKKETEEKALRAALVLVEKQVKFPKATRREEVEGYKVLRQQAVAVLAQARAPSLGDKERPALALAKVAAADVSIVPHPRVAERIEAVIGLARLIARSKDADFQADYAAEQIGRGVLAFGLAADQNIDSRVLDKDSKAGTVARARGWRVDAARMIESLDALKAFKGTKTTYVQDVVRETTRVLKNIENNRTGNTGDFGDWLGRNQPQAKSLFAKDDQAIVKPRLEDEEEKERKELEKKEKAKVGEKKEKVEEKKEKEKPKDKPKGKGKK